MISRREFLQVAAATAALTPGGWTRAFAQQRLTQAELLRFEPLGNVTLVHLTDMHAPAHAGAVSASRRSISASATREGQVPHVTGRRFSRSLQESRPAAPPPMR